MAKTIASIETISDRDEAVELLTEIEEQEVECQRLYLEVNTAKETLKDLRDDYEKAVDHLRALARRRSESNPLFDQK